MKAIYSLVRSWDMKEYYYIIFPDWKGVDEYQDPIYSTSLSDISAAVSPKVENLINPHVEWSDIINDITQKINRVIE